MRSLPTQFTEITSKFEKFVSAAPLRVSRSMTTRFSRPLIGAVAAKYLPLLDSTGLAMSG